MMKQCKKCGEIKPHYKGVGCRCKDCHKAAVSKRRLERIDEVRAYDRARGNRQPSGYSKQYYEQNKEKALATKKQYISTNPEKRAANILVGNAVRDGRLVKAPCVICGSTTRIHGHHDNYARPLDVVWLCPAHHGERHRSLRWS